jgi:hypothetical protein
VGYNNNRRDYDDDESVQHHHSSKRKRERKSFDSFESYEVSSANRKCKQCALKHECDQSNAQRCKRFRKSRGEDWDD